MIKGMINNHVKQEAIIDQAFTFDQAKAKILQHRYDILFLDITLPRGNTFDLLEQLSPEKKKESEIIFLTGHDTKEYFLNAIKHSASGYVLKPIDLDDFKAAIDKSLENLRQATIETNGPSQLYGLNNNSSSLVISLPRGTSTILSVNEISHLIGEGSLTKVHLQKGDPLSSVKNLGHYKEGLIHNHGFLIASKSIIVNPDFIEVYKPILQEITLKNGIKIPCSRRGGRNLKEWLNSMN